MNDTRHNNDSRLEELARLPDLNPGPVCRISITGIVGLANESARNIFGDAELVGKSWLDVCPGMNADMWSGIVNRDGPLKHEVDVNDVCVELTYTGADGIDDIFIFGTETTARHRAEEQLKEQADTLAQIARFPEMNPGPVVRTDTDGTVLMSNAAAHQVFGEQLTGRSWVEILPGLEDLTWARVLGATEVVSIEARVGDNTFVFAHRHDPVGRLVFIFGADVTQERKTEVVLRQSEKMATLGTLAAGVAHELNNPAAAITRAASQLHEAFASLEKSHLQLSEVAMPPEGNDIIVRLEEKAREHSSRPSDLDSLARSDAEADIEEWLEEHDFSDSWSLAPSLVGQGLDTTELNRLATRLGQEALGAVLSWAASLFPVYSLVYEIGNGSTRVSEIVGALKSYSYLGQAPINSVNLHNGLNDTLVILRSKLRGGITVVREYGEDVPSPQAYGGELNQVWTNLIDNSADAMNGEGTITIRTRHEGEMAVVEIEDDGPGIPDEIKSRIFDPFFTTKEPGEGTGLGLSTSYRIITDKHKGEMSVESGPGFTRFIIKLPIISPNLDDASAAPALDETTT